MNIAKILRISNSKKEINWPLQLQGEAHPPPLEQANYQIVLDIFRGKKKVFYPLS